ncbi:pathogenicity island protein [Staphylococcus epidermidis]
MILEQKYKLSKIVKVIEKVLEEKDKDIFLSAKDRFHSITNYRYSDTAFYEHILKLVHKELFNVLAELDFDDETFSVLDEVTMTLGNVMNEDKEVYHYSVIDDKGETKYTTDRKGHIVGILEWAFDYIVGNIDVGVIE